MKIKKYRIVTDAYCGYECQWSILGIIWTQCGFTNTHTSLKEAEKWLQEYIRIINFKSQVIKNIK